MIKFLAAAILLLAFVDLGVAHGAHVRDVVTVLGHGVHYVLHMGDGSLFGK